MYNKEIEKLLLLAKDKVDDIEIYLQQGKSFSVRVRQQKVDSFSYADSKGIGIRIIKDGKVGYSYTEEFSDDAFKTILKEAVDGSIHVENRDPVIMSNYPDTDAKPEIYSPDLDNVTVDEKIELAKELEQIAYEKDKRIFNVPYASYSDGSRYIRIVNSKGLDKEYKANYCMAPVMVLAAEGEQKKSGMSYYAGRCFKDISTDKIASEAVDKAVNLLNSISPQSGEYPVILSNEMVTSLMQTFSGIFSAKNVQEGKSLLKGKLGSQIADKCVTIYDDALRSDGLSSKPFDDEGYPTQKTVLIENGVLKSFLHNTVTAAKEKVESTGNAGRSIKTSLNVSKSNMIIDAQDNEPEKMKKYSDKVIEIVSLQGLHSGANPISGDFSLSGEGFLYEDGVRTSSLSNFTLSGNFVQMLQNVAAIGNDFLMSHTSCGAPSLLIDKLIISSK